MRRVVGWRLPGPDGFNTPLLIAAFVGLFFFGTLDNGRGPAYPKIMAELALTNRQGSLLFALTSLISFFMTVFSSRWLRILDLMKGMRLSWLILSLASFLIGLSGTLQSPITLFIAAIIQGVGMGITGMNMNLMIEAGAPVTHRRRAYGGLHATYGVASFLAPLLFTGVQFIGFGWEGFFYGLACLGPLLFFLMPRGEETFAKVPVKNQSAPVPLLLLILMGMTVGTYVASEIVISSRLVLFLEEGHSLTNARAGLYLSGFFILLMAGRLFLGLVDLPVKGPFLLVGSLLLTGIFCWLGKQGQFLFFSLTGLSMSVFFPSYMDWLASTFPENFQKVTAFVLSGIGIHLVAMHLGFGHLAELLGVIKAMDLALYLTGASLCLLGISLTWVSYLPQSKQRATNNTP